MNFYKKVAFKDLCRLCTNYNEPRVDIFGGDNDSIELISKIISCLSLKVEANDFLPKKVCELCLSKLNDFNDFRISCVNAENLLQNYYLNLKEKNVLDNGTVYMRTTVESEKRNAWQGSNLAKLLSTLQPEAGDSELHNIDGITPTVQLLDTDIHSTTSEIISSTQVSGGLEEVVGVCDLADGWKIPMGLDKIIKTADISLPNDLSQIEKILSLPPVQCDKVPFSPSPPCSKVKKKDDAEIVLSEDSAISKNNETLMVLSDQSVLCKNKNEDILNAAALSGALALPPVSTVLLLNKDILSFDPQQTIYVFNENIKPLNVDPNLSEVLNNTNLNTSLISGSFDSEGIQLAVADSSVMLEDPLVNPRVDLPELNSLEAAQINIEDSVISLAEGTLLSRLNKLEPSLVTELPIKKQKKRIRKHMFKCTICSQLFRTHGQLKAHERVHAGEKKFGCSKCDKKYFHNEHLIRHMLSHSACNWVCEYCGRKFGRKDNYSRHVKMHVIKDTTCQVCGKRFDSKLLFLQHVHSECESLKASQDSRPRQKLWHVCELCGVGFPLKSKLLRHKAAHLRNFQKSQNKPVHIGEATLPSLFIQDGPTPFTLPEEIKSPSKPNLSPKSTAPPVASPESLSQS